MKKILNFIIVVFLLNIFTSANFAIAADTAACKAVGKRIADEQSGTLKSASTIVDKGKNMCVVVVLVPGRGGEKPRRVEVAVPIN